MQQKPTALTEPDPATAAEMLRWLTEAGVETVVQEDPVDRFRASAEARAAAVSSRQDRPSERRAAAPKQGSSAPADRTLPAAPAAIPGEEAVETARQLAAGASTLEELRAALASFTGCNLRITARNLVFADGNPAAPVMFVGEAPGREEDEQGLPFVGRSGQLLDRMIAQIGLSRQANAYISNVIPWRPPGNRTPTPAETEACRPFIERHIELVGPKVLVCVGGLSAKVLLNTSDGILRLRGRWKIYRAGASEVDTIAMVHPAYLLRNPAAKRGAWQDLLKIRQRLDESEGNGGRR